MVTKYERLETVANTHFGSLANLARLIGRKNTFFHSYKTKPGIGTHILQLLKEKCNINPQYIDYGTEPMLLTQFSNSNKPSHKVNNQDMIYNIDISPIYDIETYSLPAHANVGSLIDFQDLPVTTQKLVLSFKANPKNLRGLNVSGRSMEEAHIFSKDMVVYNIVKKPKTEDQVVCILNGTIMVKSYMINNGVIELHSAYNGTKPIIVNEIDDNLEILGVVMAVISYR